MKEHLASLSNPCWPVPALLCSLHSDGFPKITAVHQGRQLDRRYRHAWSRQIKNVCSRGTQRTVLKHTCTRQQDTSRAVPLATPATSRLSHPGRSALGSSQARRGKKPPVLPVHDVILQHPRGWTGRNLHVYERVEPNTFFPTPSAAHDSARTHTRADTDLVAYLDPIDRETADAESGTWRFSQGNTPLALNIIRPAIQATETLQG